MHEKSSLIYAEPYRRDGYQMPGDGNGLLKLGFSSLTASTDPLQKGNRRLSNERPHWCKKKKKKKKKKKRTVVNVSGLQIPPDWLSILFQHFNYWYNVLRFEKLTTTF